jgi:hypothetical protein
MEVNREKPKPGERQAVEEAHQRCAEGSELGGEMALRGVAHRLRERGPDRDRDPQHGK